MVVSPRQKKTEQMTRKQYGLAFLAFLIVSAAVKAIAAQHPNDYGVADMIFPIACVAMVAAVVQRARTVGRRDWLWGLLAFVPFTALWLCGVRDPEGQLATKTGGLWRTAGITAVATVSVFAAYIAVFTARDIAATRTASVHDQLVSAVSSMSLPTKVDGITTMTHAHVDGNQLTYVYQLDGVLNDATAVQNSLNTRLCGSATMHQAIKDGASFRYEYWNGQKLLGSFIVGDCTASDQAKLY
jgi:hypothetical protein